MSDVLQQILVVGALVLGGALLIALGGLFLIARAIRELRIPPEADFFTTMRHVPLLLVVLLDLLDFALDIFSAPLLWVILDRMGLPNLRNKATIEALIPITGVIPTFTLSWVAARLFNLGDAHLAYYVNQYQAATRRAGLADERRTRQQIIDMDQD